jgi:hypothetical protein
MREAHVKWPWRHKMDFKWILILFEPIYIPGGPKKMSIFDPYYNGIRVKY